MSIASICPIEFSVGKQDKSGSLYPPKVFFLKCNPVKKVAVLFLLLVETDKFEFSGLLPSL